MSVSVFYKAYMTKHKKEFFLEWSWKFSFDHEIIMEKSWKYISYFLCERTLCKYAKESGKQWCLF